MGLDMYAYRTRAQIAPVDFEEPDQAEQIAYWRKHPNLHGWMHQLYEAKGGGQVFNCVPVQLLSADLDALERALHMNALPETFGFFYGETRPEEIDEDFAFIAKAREALRDGYFVYYSSWW
jgi:hypothetical protein